MKTKTFTIKGKEHWKSQNITSTNKQIFSGDFDTERKALFRQQVDIVFDGFHGFEAKNYSDECFHKFMSSQPIYETLVDEDGNEFPARVIEASSEGRIRFDLPRGHLVEQNIRNPDTINCRKVSLPFLEESP